MENSTPCKYKTVKDIEKPFEIYHYVAESSCCAKFYRNWITHFGWANRGSYEFFTYKHTHTIKRTKRFLRVTVVEARSPKFYSYQSTALILEFNMTS